MMKVSKYIMYMPNSNHGFTEYMLLNNCNMLLFFNLTFSQYVLTIT